MDISELNILIEKQLTTMDLLGVESPIAIYQLISISLEILKSTLDNQYYSECDQVNKLFELLQKCLLKLITPQYGKTNIIEDIIDKLRTIDVCSAKMVSETTSPLTEFSKFSDHVNNEEFSEENKEDSDWASPLSRNTISEDKDSEANPWPISELQLPCSELFYYDEEKIEEQYTLAVEDDKYLSFLNKLAQHHIYTRAPNKLYDILQIFYKETRENLASQKIFNLLFRQGAESCLIDYLH